MKNVDRMHEEAEIPELYEKQAALELLQNGVLVDVIDRSLHLSPEFINNLSQP